MNSKHTTLTTNYYYYYYYYSTLQPFNGPTDCVWDYPGELVPER